MTDTQQANKHLVQLPLMGNVAIYARVSTREKLPQDEQSQQDHLTQFANQLGYSEEQVTMFADEGTAAAAPLLKRQGYMALLQAINKGEVTVLLVSDVSRLFPDATQVQINTFMHLCMRKGVFVVTPQAVYDFSNLALVHQFRMNCMSTFTVFAEATKLMQRTP